MKAIVIKQVFYLLVFAFGCLNLLTRRKGLQEMERKWRMSLVFLSHLYYLFDSFCLLYPTESYVQLGLGDYGFESLLRYNLKHVR